MIGVDLSNVCLHSINPPRVEPNLSDVPLLFGNIPGLLLTLMIFPADSSPLPRTGTPIVILSRIEMYFRQGTRSSNHRWCRPLPIAGRLHRKHQPVPVVLC